MVVMDAFPGGTFLGVYPTDTFEGPMLPLPDGPRPIPRTSRT
jgi:hypothetical protein